MTRQIPWLRVTVESVVIVVSILLALAADAWWQRRQDLATEAALLSSLRAEIRFNLDELAAWNRELTFSTDRAAQLLSLTGPDAVSIEAARFDSLLNESLNFRTYHPSTGSINAVLAQLNLIRSEELRREVAGFQERLRDFQENFDWALDEVTVLIYHVQDRVPLFTADNARWTQAGGDQDRRLLLRRLEFANLLGGWVWRAGRMADDAATFEAHIVRMLELIEAYRWN